MQWGVEWGYLFMHLFDCKIKITKKIKEQLVLHIQYVWFDLCAIKSVHMNVTV
jgi:hypothetical protein